MELTCLPQKVRAQLLTNVLPHVFQRIYNSKLILVLVVFQNELFFCDTDQSRYFIYQCKTLTCPKSGVLWDTRGLVQILELLLWQKVICPGFVHLSVCFASLLSQTAHVIIQVLIASSFDQRSTLGTKLQCNARGARIEEKSNMSVIYCNVLVY